MKNIFIFSTIILLIFSICSCQSDYKTDNIIEFPQIGSELHGDINIKYELSDDESNLLGQQMPVYRITSRKNSKDNTYDNNLLNIFNCNTQKINKTEHYVEYICESGDRLEIYNNGSYIYRRIKNEGFSNEPLNLSDDEIVEMARGFLQDNALLPKNFEVGKTLGGTVINDDEYLMKSVGFFHTIDGYEVYGRSDITVEISAVGITTISSIYSDYVFDSNTPTLTYNEIKELNPLEYGQIVYDTSNLLTEASYIVIDDINIYYYDSPIYQPTLSFIYPVYQFHGKIVDSLGNSTDYYWTIQANKNT